MQRMKLNDQPYTLINDHNAGWDVAALMSTWTDNEWRWWGRHMIDRRLDERAERALRDAPSSAADLNSGFEPGTR